MACTNLSFLHLFRLSRKTHEPYNGGRIRTNQRGITMSTKNVRIRCQFVQNVNLDLSCLLIPLKYGKWSIPKVHLWDVRLVVNAAAARFASVPRHGLTGPIGIQMIRTLDNLQSLSSKSHNRLTVGRTEALTYRAVADDGKDLLADVGGDFTCSA